MSNEIEVCKILHELETYKQEYHFAAANKQLADALDKERTKNKELTMLMFAFVRNSCVYPAGKFLGKSEQEITDMTFATIESAKKMLDIEKMRTAMNMATDKANRYDADAPEQGETQPN